MNHLIRSPLQRSGRLSFQDKTDRSQRIRESWNVIQYESNDSPWIIWFTCDRSLIQESESEWVNQIESHNNFESLSKVYAQRVRPPRLLHLNGPTLIRQMRPVWREIYGRVRAFIISLDDPLLNADCECRTCVDGVKMVPIHSQLLILELIKTPYP